MEQNYTEMERNGTKWNGMERNETELILKWNKEHGIMILYLR